MAATDAASSLLNVSDFLIRFVAHPCLRRSHGQLQVYTELQPALIIRLSRRVPGLCIERAAKGFHKFVDIALGLEADRDHDGAGVLQDGRH